MHYHTTNPFPEVSEREYPEFVALPVRDLPPTYGEWIAAQRQANLERDRLGEKPVAVPTHLHDYKRYCDNHGLPYIAHHLMTYAFEKSPPADLR